MAKKDINRITIVGILAGDANLNETGERASLMFTVASKDGYAKKDGTESTSFIRCALSSARGGYATKMAPYLKKGTRVAIDGRLRTWSTKTEDGKYTDGYTVQADQVELLGGGNRANGDAQQAQPAATAQPAVPPANELPLDIESDDLPF